MKPELAKKGAAWRGPRASTPVIDISRYYALQFDPAQDIERFINQLYSTGLFEFVEPEYAYQMDFTPNDPSLEKQYYLKTIKAVEAWEITQGSEDITIAIVDSGGDLDHPDLTENLYINIHEIPDNQDDMEITSAVIAMAHNLKIKVVAEGIETAEQLAFLRRHRCDVGQGYLFDRPIPGVELIEKLKRYPRGPIA